ncbi:TetR/AcrR family transcriptional regulator [Nonomuraea sp. B5E05]|uniref:TetR/AcrR family transcriptional regulator n=1 Tax=Nonomuraea sp. B5E05 TaxID=3153569 RepID=UPI003261CC9C
MGVLDHLLEHLVVLGHGWPGPSADGRLIGQIVNPINGVGKRMSPRTYRSARRQAAAEETRRRALAAARELLAGDAFTKITVDTVAKAADVSRQTIYNVFGAKSGLLEALFDALATQGGMDLTEAFTAPGEEAALAAFAETFCGFWASDRLVIRRLRGMAVLDPDLGRLLRERDEMRRSGLKALFSRFEGTTPENIDVIWQLTAFETYDALAEGDRDTSCVAGLITAAALAILHGSRPGA